MKQYKSNITKDFCIQWTKSKAVQEYVSNMLDQGDYAFEFGEDYVELINYNVKVSHKALLLGLSDKTNDTSKIGMFGCGIPQSMAALLSQGVEVTIKNADVIWVPEFLYDTDWEEEVLVINESNSSVGGSNYIVTISNLEEEDIKEIKDRCLSFQDRAVIYQTSIGSLIEGEEGEIFVAGVYVTQDPSFKYSYNFNPDVVKLTQDRNMLEQWELKKLTAKLISMVEDEDFVKDAIEANTYDTQLVSDRFYTGVPYKKQTHAAVDSFAEDFLVENKGSLVTSDYDTHRENEDNNVPSVYINNSVKVKSIQESSLYKDSIENVVLVEKKTPFEVTEIIHEEIKEILRNQVASETSAEIEKYLDLLLEKSEDWSGDEVFDELGF